MLSAFFTAYTISSCRFKIKMVQVVDDIDKLCKFHEIRQQMQTVLRKQEMQICHIKMATFPLLIV